jgi:sigma-54 dependent transcriptional regulator, acetoin dehydrogenase operon transcriptional activator AcoR
MRTRGYRFPVTPIQLQRPADLRLWERFQAGDVPNHEIGDSLILRRWQRCRENGLSADSPGEPRMAMDALPNALERFSPLLAPGAPFDAFASSIANAGYCGLFCDAQGMVVARRIAEPFRTAVAQSRVIEGAVWTENARGTNGIGTTLVENTPVSVVGVEHYERRNHGLACYASPVRDVRQQVVGVLDATGPLVSADSFIHASVVATAAAIEALIIARTYDAAHPGGLFDLERLLAGLPHAALLVEMTGHVRRLNPRFRSLLPGLRPNEIVRLVQANVRGAHPDRESTPESLRSLRLEIEPIGPPDDPFAAVVHLKRPSERRRAMRMGDVVPEAFSTIVGSDQALVAARSQAARFARTDLPILLLAETGAGKEIFARAIHASSARSRAPFVAVNCGALAGTLLESELFGYGPGSFTGAAPSGRTGKLATADGGTLFLDEVGEMSSPAQAALLRFLEDGTFYRVGEASERRADVRLIAATSRELPTLVEQGRFRSDLYFRMRGVVLRLPPLRDRDDHRELAEALLENIARARGLNRMPTLSHDAMTWIEKHDWPGNVRELRSALNYAIVVAGDAPRLELWHLPIEETTEPQERSDLRASAERAALLRALNYSRGNLSGAARSLGVARSTLYRMLDRHDLRPGEADH